MNRGPNFNWGLGLRDTDDPSPAPTYEPPWMWTWHHRWAPSELRLIPCNARHAGNVDAAWLARVADHRRPDGALRPRRRTTPFLQRERTTP